MNFVRKWLKNARSVSLVQSVMPAVLAVVLAAGSPGFDILMALLAVVGTGAAHLAMNLADDYFDYRVDMLGDRDRVERRGFRAMMVKYPYLTDGSETPASLLRAILCLLAAAGACGLGIFLFRLHQNGFCGPQGCWWIVAIAATAGLLGIFYSAPPLKLGYRGLGEPVIGIIFGPLLMLGCHYAVAGYVSSEVAWVSAAVGLLVMNILYTHSFIDIAGDTESNKMTLARLLGNDRLRLAAVWAINLLPYIIIVAGAVLNRLEPAFVAVLFVLPRSLWLCGSLRDFAKGKTGVPDMPPLILGAMKGWERYKAMGIDWFMMRWLTSRNVTGSFCLIIIIAKLLSLIFFN